MTEKQPRTEQPNSTRETDVVALLGRLERRASEALDRVIPGRRSVDEDVDVDTEPADAEAVLERVRSLEVRRWQYRDDDNAVHIGPMAEEFHDAFGVGADDRIEHADAQGVTLASVQALADELERRESTIDELETELRERESTLDELEAALETRRERVDTLAAENERLRDRNEALTDRLDRLEERVGAIGDADATREGES